MEFFMDEELWKKMSYVVVMGVLDEIGIVGNVFGWFYLVVKWNEVGVEKYGKGGLKGNEKWVNDMVREEVGFLYVEGENRLLRYFM